MRAWSRFATLPPAERILVIQAAFWVAAVRLGLWFIPFDQLRRFVARFAKPAQSLASPSHFTPDRIAWAVQATGRQIPHATCLTLALAALVLLQRNGYAADLRIGVALDGERDLRAHAWVEYEGRAIVGAAEKQGFQPLSRPDGTGI